MYDVIQIFDYIFKLIVLIIIIDSHPLLQEFCIDKKKKIFNISLNIYISLISLYLCDTYFMEGIISPFTYANNHFMSIVYLFISFKILTLTSNSKNNNLKKYLQILIIILLIINNKCGFIIVLLFISLFFDIFENIDKNDILIKRIKILVFEKINLPILFISFFIILLNSHKMSILIFYLYLLFLFLLIPFNIKNDYFEIKKYNKLYNEKKYLRTRYMGPTWVEVFTFHRNGISRIPNNRRQK